MTHIINPKITQRQRAFVIGTILGGSSIVKPTRGKNCYLSMRSRDIQWLRYKATELQSLASNNPITVEKTNRWHSICYPLFNEFRDMFYDKGRRSLNLNNLSLLRDITLAIWFGDCGIRVHDSVVINTHIWNEEGTKIISEYFGYLGYESEIVKQRDNYRVRLDKKSSMDFFKIVAPHLPILS
jgi:hypothetical protein